MKIQEMLTEAHVPFEVLEHEPTYDAQHMAQAVHVSGRHVAKTVLLRADHGYSYVVAVLPAAARIDLEAASKGLGGSHLELATEVEIGEHCPDCEFGVLPPFGSRYDMRTILDRTLSEDAYLVFEGNTHCESVRMRSADFRALENPLVIDFARMPPPR